MKKFAVCLSVFSIVFLALASLGLRSLEARDLTYKFGFGYEQISTNGFVSDQGVEGNPVQLHGLTFAYGVANDMMVDLKVAMGKNLDNLIVGPSFRYDFQCLFSRNPASWDHVNIFVKAAFFIKTGDQVKTGITIHAPYLGFEILPFDSNHFAILTQAGVVIDFVEENMIGFTNGMFGDVGVRFYF